MNYKKLDKYKLRSRLVRKGIFTQLPPISKDMERETKPFRTIIDHNLFSATSKNPLERKEAFKWFHPNTSEDFNAICSLAGLNPEKTRIMMLTFLDNFFPEIFEQTSCSFTLEEL